MTYTSSVDIINILLPILSAKLGTQNMENIIPIKKQDPINPSSFFERHNRFNLFTQLSKYSGSDITGR